jgi:nucleotide-binding universal stress UspA family protein
MNELVVGVDGSEESRRALRWAAAVASAVGVRLALVQAWTGGDPAAADQTTDRVKGELARAATEVLGPAAADLDITYAALHGSAAGVILQRVTPDSGLVLGSRGRGGFAGLLLGSVSRACIEHAPCPVMVIRHEPVPLTGASIVVGHDGSPSADRALEWAVALAQPMEAKVIAAYMWQASSSEVPPRLHERLTADATRSIAQWASSGGTDVQPVEAEGEPRTELVRLAERLHAGLVVVGRRGTGGVRALRMGSVASYLVTSSPLPIAVVPRGSES